MSASNRDDRKPVIDKAIKLVDNYITSLKEKKEKISLSKEATEGQIEELTMFQVNLTQILQALIEYSENPIADTQASLSIVSHDIDELIRTYTSDKSFDVWRKPSDAEFQTNIDNLFESNISKFTPAQRDEKLESIRNTLEALCENYQPHLEEKKYDANSNPTKATDTQAKLEHIQKLQAIVASENQSKTTAELIKEFKKEFDDHSKTTLNKGSSFNLGIFNTPAKDKFLKAVDKQLKLAEKLVKVTYAPKMGQSSD